MLPAIRFGLIDDLVEGVFDDAFGAEFLELWDDLADDFLVDDGLDGNPARVGELGDGGVAKGGEGLEEGFEAGLLDVHFQADFVAGVEGAGEEEDEAFDLGALPRVGPGGFVGDELRGGSHDGIQDAQVVRAERGAGLGDIDDGIDEIGDFDFGGAPGEFDLGGDAVLLEEAAGEADGLGGDALALEVFYGTDRGILGDGDNPAGGIGAGLRESEFADDLDVGAVLDDPVVPCEAAIKEALLDVAGYFLGAQEAKLKLRVIDGGPVGAAGDVDGEAGFGKKGEGGILEAP